MHVVPAWVATATIDTLQTVSLGGGGGYGVFSAPYVELLEGPGDVGDLRDRQPGGNHEADAESDAKRTGPRVLDRFHGQSAYRIGLRVS